MEYLDNFEKFVHYDEKDRLVQLAIVHAQFETIHPFIDGNGRVGRILIPLFLVEKKLLSAPTFYISAKGEKKSLFRELGGLDYLLSDSGYRAGESQQRTSKGHPGSI